MAFTRVSCLCNALCVHVPSPACHLMFPTAGSLSPAQHLWTSEGSQPELLSADCINSLPREVPELYHLRPRLQRLGCTGKEIL